MKSSDLKFIGILYESIKLKRMFSREEIAKKHKVDLDKVDKALKKGIQTEYEHTNDEETATTIASHHLMEDLDYYTKLKKIENN